MIGNPADPLYGPYNKTRKKPTREEDGAMKKAMGRDAASLAEDLEQENINRIFANLAKLNRQVGAATGDFPIKVTTGDEGMKISIDPSAIKKNNHNTAVLDRWQEGNLGTITVLIL